MTHSQIEQARADALRFADSATRLLKLPEKDHKLFGRGLLRKMVEESKVLSRSLVEMRRSHVDTGSCNESD